MKLPSSTVPICLTHLWGWLPFPVLPPHSPLHFQNTQMLSNLCVRVCVGGKASQTSTREAAAGVLARPGLGSHAFLSGWALQRCPWERQRHWGSPHLSSVQRSPFTLSSGADSSSLQHLQPLCGQPLALPASSLPPSWVTLTKAQLSARPVGTDSCLEAEVQICKPWRCHC